MDSSSEIKMTPAVSLQGELEVASDKSISHRAIILGSLANGKTTIQNFLNAQDCLSTVKAFQSMGVSIQIQNKAVTIEGVGLKGLKAPNAALDMGNSGTSMRLLMGLLAGQSFNSTLIGDESLSKRPMKRVIEPLQKMGAQIKAQDNQFAPIEITGQSLKGIHFEEKLGSAQVKSALLLAGLFAKGDTVVVEKVPSRDHTERILMQFGAHFSKKGNALHVNASQPLKACDIFVPGDISSAAFFMVAALLVPNSEVIIRRVGLNPTRCGILDVLLRMGAHIELMSIQHKPEPYGDIKIKSSHLDAAEVSENIPFLIDELPILMVACARARGKSVIRNVGELRVKETDRIQSMCDNLTRLGVKVQASHDEITIEGTDHFKGNVRLTSFGDHRTAMSCAIAGLVAQSEITVEDVDCIKTSFPNFFDQLKSVQKS